MTAEARPVLLLVEDDPLVRLDSCACLSDAGFEVLEAVDVDDALSRIRDRDDIAVMVTDVQMPGALDGLALARVVATLRPHVQVVVTSGGLQVRDHELPRGVAFVPKPYAVDGLARRLSAAL